MSDGPNGSDNLSGSDLRRIIEARRKYEHAFQSDEKPRIEKFLVGLAEPERSDVFKELLSLEIELFQESGQNVTSAEYQKRFPEYEQLILWTFRRNADNLPRAFGEYEVIRELGRGGMGIVYEARHRSLEKRAAVKVLPSAGTLDVRARIRFRNEARAAAHLDHPNIVPVYSIGVENGLDYYVMQYIPGRNLDDLVRCLQPTAPLTSKETSSRSIDDTPVHQPAITENWDGKASTKGPAPDTDRFEILASTERSGSHGEYFRYIARIFADVASALQHAHDLGIVHRDIKPSNLLLDSKDKVWITDFGLAQIQGEPGLTRTGDVIGTLRYMSPEQALAKRVVVDLRTDIYSLGVTLYELLTFRPAYDGETREAVLRQIAFDSPPAPRKIVRALPDDLNTIVLKAMERRPDDRYQTAQALATDLARFLRHESPLIPPTPLWKKLVRWAQRHRTLVTALAAIWVILFASILAILFVAISANNQLQRANRQIKDAQKRTERALTDKTRFAEQLEKQKMQTEVALVAEQQSRRNLEIALDVSKAQELLARAVAELESNPTKALLLANLSALGHQSLAVRNALIAAIMGVQEHKMLNHDGVVSACRFSPDGRWVATIEVTIDENRAKTSLLLWDVEKGTPLATLDDGNPLSSVVFSPDSHRLLLAYQSGADGRELPPTMWTTTSSGQWQSTPSFVFSGASIPNLHQDIFHPDGQHLVLPAGSAARIYSVVNPQEFITLDHEGQKVIYAAYGPLGENIITVAQQEQGTPTVRVFDADRRTLRFRKDFAGTSNLGSSSLPRSTQIHPSKDLVLTASPLHGIELWSLTEGTRFSQGFWRGSEAYFADAGEKIVCLENYGKEIDIRDTESGAILRSFVINDDLSVAAVSADGRRLATVGGDTAVRVWDLVTLELISTLRGHTGQILALDINADGARVATGGHDRTTRVWNAQSRRERFRVSMPLMGRGPIVDATADNKQILAVTHPQERLAACTFDGGIESAMIGKATKHSVSEKICLAVVEGRADAWNPANGEKLGSLKLPEITLKAADRLLAYSAASGWGAIGLTDGRIALWDPSTNQRRFLVTGGSTIAEIVMRDDGQWIASATEDGTVTIWSVESGEVVHQWKNPEKLIGLAISPSGNRLAAVTIRDTCYIWDLADFRQLATVSQEGRHFDEARFSSAGDYLVTLDTTQADVSVWDGSTGAYVRGYDELSGHSQYAVDADGDSVAVCSQGNQNGAEAGAIIWSYRAGGEPHRLTDRSIISIALGNDKVVALAAAPETNIINRTLEPFQYSADAAAVMEGKFELIAWNLAGEQLSSKTMHLDAQYIYYLDESDRALVQNRQHGYAAYAREENDRQYPDAYGHSGRISDLISTSTKCITSGYDGALVVWERSTGARSMVEMRYSAAILDIDANPAQPSQVAAAAADGTVQVWNTENGTSIEIVPAGHHQAWFVQFDSTGRKLLSVHRDGSVILSDVNGREPSQPTIRTSDVHQLSRAKFSPDGSKLLTLEGINDGKQEPFKVRIYNTSRPDDPPIAELSHTAPIRSADFDAKAEHVVVADSSGKIMLWQIDPVREVRRIGQAEQQDHYEQSPPEEQIYVEFSPDGECIYAEFSDYSGVSDYAYLFQVADGKPVMAFPLVHANRAAATNDWAAISRVFTPDSRWALAGFGQRSIYASNTDNRVRKTPTRPIEFGKQIAPRELTPDELKNLGISDREVN